MNPWDGFADPWEHARLLSDAGRNATYVAWLRANAPGRRVMEVGCGSGLLSVIAARCGARSVLAVEPTPMAEVAAALVARNGLGDVVRVVRAPIQEVPPEPVDAAFFELFNADPFVEGALPVGRAIAPFLAPGGVVAPRRLRVCAAALRAAGSALEVRDAGREVQSLALAFDLDLSPVHAVLSGARTYRYFSESEAPAGPPVVVWDLDLLHDPDPTPRRVRLPVHDPGPVGGVVVWFESAVGDTPIGNPPGDGGHWGQLVCAFGAEIPVRRGEALAVDVAVRDGAVWVEPAAP